MIAICFHIRNQLSTSLARAECPDPLPEDEKSIAQSYQEKYVDD
jgi:hypothetical protein